MNIKLSCICITILLFQASVKAQELKTDQLTQKLVEAINSRDAQRIIPLLDDSCKISTLPRGINNKIVPMIFNDKFTTISSYNVLKSTDEVTGTRVFLAVEYANGKSGKPDFLFGKNGKVLDLNIIKAKAPESKPTNLMQPINGYIPDYLKMPFQLFDNLVIVPAEVNGRKGSFQFDSGSAITILNQNEFTGQTSAGETFTGINGASQLNKLLINKIGIGSMNISDFTVFTSSDAGPEGTFGLLGYDLVRDFEVVLDYQTQTLELVKTDSLGNRIVAQPSLARPLLTIPMIMQRHIPIIKIKIGGKEYAMGLDCGANSDLFFDEHYNDIKATLKDENEVDMNGLGDRVVKVKSALIDKTYVDKLLFENLATVFTANNMGNASTPDRLRIDGILGYPFLSRYKIAINYKKQTVSFFETSR